jgi:hypothetical protein
VFAQNPLCPVPRTGFERFASLIPLSGTNSSRTFGLRYLMRTRESALLFLEEIAHKLLYLTENVLSLSLDLTPPEVFVSAQSQFFSAIARTIHPCGKYGSKVPNPDI